MKNAQMLIDGKWVEGKEFFLPKSPATGETFSKVPLANKNNVDDAVSAAREALQSWRNTPIQERCAILQKAADLLVQKYGEPGEETALKRLIHEEMGKRLPEADIEVIESSDMIAFFAANAPKLLESKTPQLNQELWATKSSSIKLEPIGVVGVIKAWNYPLEIPIWAIAPALASGNTIVFKPSDKSSLVGVELGKIFEEAGLPKGVLNIVTGDASTGKLVVEHNEIDMISFTGSVAVGKEIAIECAKRLRKCTLELGGNDAAIVTTNADLDLAANGLVWGSFCNAGQVCVRSKRIYVHKDVAKSFINKVLEKTKSLRKDIEIAPIVDEVQLKKVEEAVNDAIEKGANIAFGGKKYDADGFFFEPTIITDLTGTEEILSNECFGPIMPIIEFDDNSQAIQYANNSNYGLGASVWSSDKSEAEKIANELNVGMVWINDVNVAFPEAPWGGVKDSGLGVDLSEWGLYEYVKIKHVNTENSDDTTREWWYPY